MDLPDYTNDDYKQFVQDMISAGLEENLQHYDGRFYYHGPGVRVESIEDAMGVTDVPCQWDSLGLDYIVYPK